jgi:hypothetical protein
MNIPLDLPRIIHELQLNVPIYCVRSRGDCVELHLYGGKVVTWKPNTNDQFFAPIEQKMRTVNASAIKTETKKTRNGGKQMIDLVKFTTQQASGGDAWQLHGYSPRYLAKYYR